MKKAILWDNDGVLVDTEPLYFRANQETLAEYNCELTRDLYIEVSLKQGKSVIEIDAFKHKFSAEEIPDLKAKRDRRYAQLLRTEDCGVTGVREMLAGFSNDFRMGVVTSSKREHFDIIHERTDLLRYIEFVLTPADYEGFKPDPAPYLAGIRKTGLPVEECIVVEDTERGLASARAAGLDCVVVRHELTKDCAFEGAVKIVDRLTEITRELLGGI